MADPVQRTFSTRPDVLQGAVVDAIGRLKYKVEDTAPDHVRFRAGLGTVAVTPIYQSLGTEEEKRA